MADGNAQFLANACPNVQENTLEVSPMLFTEGAIPIYMLDDVGACTVCPAGNVVTTADTSKTRPNALECVVMCTRTVTSLNASQLASVDRMVAAGYPYNFAYSTQLQIAQQVNGYSQNPEGGCFGNKDVCFLFTLITVETLTFCQGYLCGPGAPDVKCGSRLVCLNGVCR